MTNQRLPGPVKSKWRMAKKIAEHHFGKVTGIEFKPAGKTNAVFEIKAGKGSYIIRIAPTRAKINDFYKEQWAIQKARSIGIPAPEIIEVCQGLVPFPYMIQVKSRGFEAIDHPRRLEILKELGEYARMIHSIPTTGYGRIFDWSHNKRSAKKTWLEYLDKELQVNEGLNYLKQQGILDQRRIKRLYQYFERIKKWKLKPSLNHCDLRLKNVIISGKGEIEAIIDWDNCSSNIAPYWDLSIALHDLSIDGKQKFLEGYQLDTEHFAKLSYSLTAFNLINYVPAIRELVDKKNYETLELYRLRLNGDLDLFSL